MGPCKRECHAPSTTLRGQLEELRMLGERCEAWRTKQAHSDGAIGSWSDVWCYGGSPTLKESCVLQLVMDGESGGTKRGVENYSY